jgi:hypothetical protein
MGTENTPPASPGVAGDGEDNDFFEDDIGEEIEVGEGEAGVRGYKI